MPGSSVDLHIDGLHVLYTTLSLAFESLFYGIYIVLVPFSTHILLKRGLRSRSNIFLFIAMFVPFVLSSLYWAVEVVEQAVRIDTLVVHRERRNTTNITTYSTIFNAIVLFNYIFGDAIVVWRSWVLCRAEYGKILLLPVMLLGLTTLTVLGTICAKIMTFTIFANGTPSVVTTIINVLQTSTLFLSLITNIAATAIISHKAWRYRVTIKAGLNTRDKSTRAERIFALLMESGFIYCISGGLVLAFAFVRLPSGTLGDIYSPVNAHIAGIYPTIVVVLIGLDRTLNDASFWQSDTAGSVQDTSNSRRARASVSHMRFNHEPDAYLELQPYGKQSENVAI